MVAFGAVAQADTSITFTGSYGPDEAVNVYWNNTSIAPQGDQVVAGFLQFSNNSGGPSPFEAICGDIFDDISSGSTYNVTPEATNPYTGGSVTYTTPPVTVSSAAIQSAGNIVGADFSNAYSSGSSAQAAGLQIAVWTTLYDGAYNSGDGAVGSNAAATVFNNLIAQGSGNTLFAVTGEDAGALGYAISDWESNGTQSADSIFLKADPTGSGQDQFTINSQFSPSGSPEPFTLAIGAAGICLAIRRKVKRAS